MPKRVDHDQRRRGIGEALLRIAATRGLQAVTMREVAAEAGVSLRLVQYYFETKDQLLVRSLEYLAERLDARVRRRAAELAAPLTRRDVVTVVLTSVLPLDAERRADALASTAYYAVALTDPMLAAVGVGYPGKLERYLAGTLRDAQGTGELPAGIDPEAEAAILLALVNGLTSAVLGGQHGPKDVLRLLAIHLDRLFGPTAPPVSPGLAG